VFFMSIPTARVKVEVLTVKGVAPKTLSPGQTRYARAYFQSGGPQIATGRSRPIPDAGGDFDVSGEAAPWVFETDVYPGYEVFVGVEVEEDHGDDPPPIPLSMSMTPPLLGLGVGIIEDPWTSGVRTFGKIEVRVTTTLVNPVDKVFLARATLVTKPSGVVTIFQGYLVEMVDILGLYKPSGEYRPGVPLPLTGAVNASSKRVPGYLSDDNLGRIFTNRRPDGTWAKDTQFIEIQLKITAFGGLTIPAGAKIDWIVEDVDDPTNEARDFHREWGRYVDPNDYDGAGKPLGAHPADNAAAFKAGNANENKLFGAAASSPTARWAAATGGPAPSASSRSRAHTPITLTDPRNGVTSVRIHCMNVLGTNLRVKAELTGTPAGSPVFNASSGVMTMWSRIDVEVVRMDGARSVSAATPLIPKFFLPACVQLDFHSEKTVTGPLVKNPLASVDDDNVFDAAATAWVSNPGVFTHGTQPGWFFLGAAGLPNPLPPPGTVTPLVVDDSTYHFSDDTLRVSGDASGAQSVIVLWGHDADGNSFEAGFGVRRGAHDAPVLSSGQTKLKLWGNDVTPDFTGHDSDGSTDHAMATAILYFPRAELHPGSSSFVPGGFNIPETGAKAVVFGPGARVTTGVSPTLKNAHHPDADYFAGRTILFTQTFTDPHDPTKPMADSDFKDEVISTVVHEFCHAFGMPHKCGHWDWRTPRKKSCCMNYDNTWLVDDHNHLIPSTMGKQDNEMCGRHMMEVRRVHLEKNLGLNW